jgi:uncharacterized protein YkwD
MKRIHLPLVLLLLVTGLLAGGASATRSAQDSTSRLEALEQGLLIRLNDVRAGQGLRPLTLASGLENAAVAHSRSMLDAGFFEHESADGSPFSARVRRYYGVAGFERWAVGENLLYTTGEISAARVIKAWMDSPSHRRNMLSPAWREAGIGALRTRSAGGTFAGRPTLVVTMDFGSRSGKGAQEATARESTSAAK